MHNKDGLSLLAEKMVSDFEKLTSKTEGWADIVKLHIVAFKTLLWQLVAYGDFDAPRRAVELVTEMNKKVDQAMEKHEFDSGIFLACIEIYDLGEDVHIAQQALVKQQAEQLLFNVVGNLRIFECMRVFMRLQRSLTPDEVRKEITLFSPVLFDTPFFERMVSAGLLGKHEEKYSMTDRAWQLMQEHNILPE